jgi:hypothetical protein
LANLTSSGFFRPAMFGLAAVSFLSACATAAYVDMTQDDSESLLSYVDFSKVARDADTSEYDFELIKRECAVQASALDTTLGVEEAGIIVGTNIAAGALVAAAVPVTAPVAILSFLLSTAAGIGSVGISGQVNAPSLKTSALVTCLREKGYDVDIRRK